MNHCFRFLNDCISVNDILRIIETEIRCCFIISFPWNFKFLAQFFDKISDRNKAIISLRLLFHPVCKCNHTAKFTLIWPMRGYNFWSGSNYDLIWPRLIVYFDSLTDFGYINRPESMSKRSINAFEFIIKDWVPVCILHISIQKTFYRKKKMIFFAIFTISTFCFCKVSETQNQNCFLILF